jgi:hypothetical protein
MESTNLYKNEIPQFDGQNYSFWSIRMNTYIQAQGFQVWKSIVDGYTAPTIPPTNDKAVKLGENNSKAKNALLKKDDFKDGNLFLNVQTLTNLSNPSYASYKCLAICL